MPDLIAPITAVTVYNDRAQVTRKGTQRLAAGEHELRINGLPQFLRDSLRANGRGPQGTRILNVDVSNEYHPRSSEEDIARLQSELDALIQSQRLLEAQQEALRDRRQWLRSLGEQSKDFARGIAQGQMKAQDCADFFQFMSTQARQDAEAALNLDDSIVQAQDAVLAKQRELNNRQGYSGSDRLSASVTVALAQDGDIELEISYIIYGASWHPTYDVRVIMDKEQQNSDRGHIELTYQGIVEQNTHEDWKSVALTLSTARPSQATILPELHPWYIQPLPPPQPVAASAPAMARHRTMTQSSPAPMGSANNAMVSTGIASFAEVLHEPEPITAEIDSASSEYRGTALVFHVGGSSDIPSDNTPHKTMIAHEELPCEFDYVSAPALEQNVHVRGTITNTTERVLLPGQANIFMEGEYVGSTRIKQSATNEQFEIFLGLDDRIKVERKRTEQSVDKGGNLLQSDIRRSTYTYHIIVHNYTTSTKNMVIYDHLPVAQHERIKIRTLNVTPAPIERTKLEILTWKFALAANREQAIEYRFTIEHPGDMHVIGMPQ